MFKNASFMLLTNLARLASGVIVFVFLGRVWGPDLFGSFMYPFTVSTLLSMVVDYGFTLQLVRDVGRRPADAPGVMQNALHAKMTLTVLTLVLLAGISFLVGGDSTTVLLLWLLFVAATMNSFGIFFNLPLRGLDRFGAETRIAVIANAVFVVVIGTLAFLHASPIWVALGFIASRLFYLVLAIGSYRRHVGHFDLSAWSWRASLPLLRTGFPFGVHLALGTLYFQVDTLVVQHVLGARGVGQYQAAVRLMIAGLVIADAITNAYLHPIAAASGTPDAMLRLVRRLNLSLVVTGGLGYVALALLGGPVVQAAFGSGYSEIAPLLPLLGVVLFLRYAGAGYGLVLTVADRQVVRMIGVIIAAVVSLWLNLFLIPRFGLPGTVYASILTHLVLNAVYVAFAARQMRSLALDQAAWLGILTIAVVSLLLGTRISPLMPGLVAGVVFVGITVVALRRQVFKIAPALASRG